MQPARPRPFPTSSTAPPGRKTAPPALTELALRTGFRGIDTANQRRHYFEAGVGQALAAAYRAGVVTRARPVPADQVHLPGRPGPPAALRPRAPISPRRSPSRSPARSSTSATDHVDSYVLHGPASGRGWTDDDAEVWAAMVQERDAGRTRAARREQRLAAPPRADGGVRRRGAAFVQNRCFARPRLGPRRSGRSAASGASSTRASRCSPPTRRCCATRWSPASPRALEATPAQVVFRFAQAVGMLPLTGTSDAEHMRQDLASRDLALSADEVRGDRVAGRVTTDGPWGSGARGAHPRVSGYRDRVYGLRWPRTNDRCRTPGRGSRAGARGRGRRGGIAPSAWSTRGRGPR